MLEADESSFQRDVLDASREMPVLVDFWAPWCAPCRALGPLLERLEQSYAGRFKLVKVDSDANAPLAARFQVRSIPYVLAFKDGASVDGFVGALPEGQLRAFIERVMPGPAENERRKGLALIEAGHHDAAAAALRTAIAIDPAGSAARLDLAGLLLDRLPPPVDEGRLDEAADLLAAVARADRGDARFRAIEARMSALRSAMSLAPAQALLARVAADPHDLAARFDLAQRHVAEREFAAALDQLLEIIARDRRYGDDAARRLMLSVFELAAGDPELVSTYRRRLSAVINR